MKMPQRFRDWLHECEIDRLGRACSEAAWAGDKAKARHFWAAMGDAIRARSPAQVARMEQRMGAR